MRGSIFESADANDKRASIKRMRSLAEQAASEYGANDPRYKAVLQRYNDAMHEAVRTEYDEQDPNTPTDGRGSLVVPNWNTSSPSDGRELEKERSELALLWELGWPLLIGRIADEIASLSLGVFTGRMETVDQAAQYNVVSGQQFTLVFIFGAQQALYTMVPQASVIAGGPLPLIHPGALTPLNTTVGRCAGSETITVPPMRLQASGAGNKKQVGILLQVNSRLTAARGLQQHSTVCGESYCNCELIATR